jgi:uncharacterized membrane protein
MKKILGFFFQGLLLTAPIGITGYVLFKLFYWVDNILPFKIPGMGFFVILLLLVVLGFFAKTFLLSPIMLLFDSIIAKTPFVKIIYSSIKDILSAFVGNEKKFKNPVLVRVNNVSNLHKIGFLTQKDLSKLSLSDAYVSVYFPHSYAFSGELYIVPSADVSSLNISASDAMKFIVSGGIAGTNSADNKELIIKSE